MWPMTQQMGKLNPKPAVGKFKKLTRISQRLRNWQHQRPLAVRWGHTKPSGSNSLQKAMRLPDPPRPSLHSQASTPFPVTERLDQGSVDWRTSGRDEDWCCTENRVMKWIDGDPRLFPCCTPSVPTARMMSLGISPQESSLGSLVSPRVKTKALI